MSDMEIISEGAPPKLPIALFATCPLARMTGRGGESFHIIAGLDQFLVAQLRAYSLDESDREIQDNTSDRARFGEGSYEQWYAKDRVPFALVDSKRKLAALAWFGPKPLGRRSLKHLSAEERLQDERQMDSKNWHTIVYRSYKPFRGTGLMKAFVGFCMQTYCGLYPHANIWTGIFADNPASKRLSEKLGFAMLESASDPASHETIMVWYADEQ